MRTGGGKSQEMAELYVGGPSTVRGDWHAAAEAAGFKRVPPLANNQIRDMIRALGGEPPPLGDLDNLLVQEEITEEDVVTEAKRVRRLIAAGKVVAKAGQVMALKQIITEAKEGTDDASLRIPVIFLPLITGHAGVPEFCPVCKERELIALMEMRGADRSDPIVPELEEHT